MPGGDHLHIIDPPGLTVMRIAGGRYRVTAAHRVVWTWMNEFAPLTADDDHDDESVNHLQVGDLVSMTVVDVFETDNQGKLLSYCPTFDNRVVTKTHPTTETLRRGGSQLLGILGRAKKSKTAASLFRHAQSVARSVKSRVDQAVHGVASSSSSSPDRDEKKFSSDLDLQQDLQKSNTAVMGPASYMADEELERHEC